MSRLRTRLTFSNVISVIALFIALGGSTYAAVKLKKNQVKSKHIAAEAVQGVDANESSFGTVPRADQANLAANATNASTLEGLGPTDLLGQGGNGFDDAIAGFVDSGVTGGILVFEGGVGVACDDTPQLVYEDIGGDPFDTDLWVEGAPHEEVTDGGDGTPRGLNPLGESARVHIWGGGGTVADVLASAVWDGVNNECRVAFTSQENLDTGASATSASARADRDLDRGGLPAGWVQPSGGR